VTHSVDIHVGSRLRALRRRRGISQEHLASKLGVSFQQIQKYEKGANRISASSLFEAAEALDVSIMDFFEGLYGLDENGKPIERSALPIDHNVRHLIAIYRSLETEQEQKRFLEAAAVIARPLA